MKLSGLQKMTLLDYPGKVACTVFLQGCNYRCPFCHNSGLLAGSGQEQLEEAEFFRFLEKRRGLLDAVCVSGGEPTLQPGLEEFARRIKALGYLVKLDTNGTAPEVLKNLVTQGTVDYVAMDVKAGPGGYAQCAGVADPGLDRVEESLRFLLGLEAGYELRTTVVEQLHGDNSFLDIGRWLQKLDPDHKAKRFFIQPFIDRESVAFSGLTPPNREKMDRFCADLAPFVEQVKIRGEE